MKQNIIAVFYLQLFLLIAGVHQAHAQSDSSRAALNLRVLMLLPLQLEQLEVLDTVAPEKAQIIPATLPAIHAYESALLFRDSLASSGLNLVVDAVDFGRDSLKTVSRLNTLSGEKYDLVVSLLPAAFNSPLAIASLRWKKPVYLFQAGNNQFLCRSPWLRLMVASNTTQVKLFAAWLQARYPDGHFITVARDQRREKDLAILFAQVIDSLSGDSLHVQRHQHVGKAVETLHGKLKKAKQNILFVPTADEAFLTSLMNSIDKKRSDYPIVLCGLPTWENFETIGIEMLDSLNTHIFNGTYMDATSASVIAFRKSFISANHADPLPQAYLTWDALADALSRMDSTRTIERFISTSSMDSIGSDCGLENRVIQVLRYKEFRLIPAN
jgi:hypothetical protein